MKHSLNIEMTDSFDVALSSGDPDGIGYDLSAMLFEEMLDIKIKIFANQKLLLEKANHLGIDILSSPNKNIQLHDISLTNNYNHQKLVIDTINQSASSCQSGECRALVTLPVNKKKLNNKDLNFIGHTEHIAKILKIKDAPIMSFTTDIKNIVVTHSTHLSLKKAIDQITTEKIIDKISYLNNCLKKQLKIKKPRILVTGLNPHAGEDGLIGNEEKLFIIPAVKKLNAMGVSIDGPVAGDSAYSPSNRQIYDCIYFMFHDQALCSFKSLFFSNGVNLTLGLPIIRTSVDHGTAENLVGHKNKISTKSMLNAINIAMKITKCN
jgi:4-hydroxythreonine-4-phosphate dehydrogenase